MRTITLPDGRTIQVDDGATHEQIVGAIAHASANAPAPAPARKPGIPTGFDPLQAAAHPESDSNLENFAAGMGKGMTDTGRALKQLGLAVASPVSDAAERRSQELMKENAEIQDRDVALMATPGGFGGNFEAQLLPMLFGGGEVKAATAAPKATAGVINALKGYGSAMAQGAGFAQLAPTSRAGERGTNTFVGALTGGALKGGVDTLVGTYNLGKEAARRMGRELGEEAKVAYESMGSNTTGAVNRARKLVEDKYQQLRGQFNARYTANEANPNLVPVELPNTRAGIASVPDSITAQLMVNPKVRKVIGGVKSQTDPTLLAVSPQGQPIFSREGNVAYGDVTQSLKEVNKLIRSSSRDDPGRLALQNLKESLEADLKQWGVTGGNYTGKMPASEVARNQALNQQTLAERGQIQSDYGSTLAKFYDPLHPLNKLAKPKGGMTNPQLSAEGRLLSAEAGPELSMVEQIVPGYMGAMRDIAGTRSARAATGEVAGKAMGKVPENLYSPAELAHRSRIASALQRDTGAASLGESDAWRTLVGGWAKELPIAALKLGTGIAPYRRLRYGVDPLNYTPADKLSASIGQFYPYLMNRQGE